MHIMDSENLSVLLCGKPVCCYVGYVAQLVVCLDSNFSITLKY